MYNFDLKNVVPSRDLTCLFAKATIDESNLWHRRMGHVNFKTMNKLMKENLMRESNTKPPVRQNLFSWVFFLTSKDETSRILKRFITEIENQLNHKVKVIREFSVARTPQQNGVAERKNRTLIETTRTMLVDLLLPNVFWAEVVNTACYVLKRVLSKPHNKTPYELIIGRPPSISFMRPFGCLVTILNTLDPLGKFDGKAEEGFLVGHSVNSKAFKVFNSQTKKVKENLHVNFLENKPNVAGQGPNWLFDIDSLTNSMNYQPITVGNQTNKNAGPQEANGNIVTYTSVPIPVEDDSEMRSPGVVGLTQWFEKMESVYIISNYTVACQVKFATCTLQGNALTWWNSHVKTTNPVPEYIPRRMRYSGRGVATTYCCLTHCRFTKICSESDPEEEPEEDDEDPEEDPADYPTDRDDDDDDNEDEDEDEEEEEHPDPVDSVPPVHRMTARISIRDEPSISLPPREEVWYEIGESSAAAATRPIGGRRADYGFVGQADHIYIRVLSIVSMIVSKLYETTQLLEGVNQRVTNLSTTVDQETTIMDRPVHHRLAVMIEKEARMAREDWGLSIDASDYVRSDVMSLRTTIVGQRALILELQLADHKRQGVIKELLAAYHQRQVQLTKALKLLKGLQTQMAKFQRQHGPAKGPAQPDVPGEAGSSS
ncbi:putative ribonuclease H-like domain-containing protein [Tanacetum coccineum]